MAFARLSAPLRDLTSPPHGQNPALDVLRTCAILMVIFGHSLTPINSSEMSQSFFSKLALFRGCWTGVDLFFVLSGYLIGRQLWRELQSTNRIRIGRFILRRGLRIWPLYFAVLAFTVLVIKPDKAFILDWLPDAVFIANYFGPQVVEGGWSLCIEEQFYLLAPVALLLAMPKIKLISSFRPFLIGLFLLLPVIRAAVWAWLTWNDPTPSKESTIEALYYPFHTHADGLVIGMLVANLDSTGSIKKINFLGRWWVVLLSCAVGGLLFAVQPRYFNYTALALIFGSFICFCLPRTETMPGAVRARPFYILSRLSYGMYLNHQWMTWPIFQAMRDVPLISNSPVIFSIVYFLALSSVSALAASLTYCVIEYPFLHLREWLMHGKASSTPATPKHAVIAGIPLAGIEKPT